MKQWKSSLRIGVVFLVGLLLPTLELWAQDWERLSPSCDVGTRSLDFPFAGGLQAPQFSQGDFNGDGTDDIFVFDRSGNVGMIFLQDSGSYQFSSTHSARLPALRDWALARDFNGDGIVDLFSRAPGVQGMTVHRGSLVNRVMQYDPWHFASDVQALTYPSSSGHPINLYAAATDIPAITDLDQDGDLDVLSFDQTGTFAVYYRNQSVESGFGSDSLIYTLEDPCWGKFAENSLTNDVTLSSNNRDCAAFASNGRSGSGLHSGSTISTLDIDDDGDQEIFLGDIAFKNLVYLKNGGSNDTAFITSFSTEYPNDDPVSVEFFPASFFLDLNGDGLKELVASPNQLRSRERSGIVFLYQAEEDMGQIRHVPDRNGFIHPDMLDFGTESAPLPIDIDGDGLLDLLVGSRNHLGAPAGVSGTLFYFRNTGSMESPAYTLVDSNFLNLAEIDLLGADALAPVAVNLDGDDDMDLLIGNKLGKLFYVENRTQSQGFSPGVVQYPWFDVDVGFSSYPAAYDVNGDGLEDLLIGEEIGNINLLINTGTASEPQFDPDPESGMNEKNFGLIDARQGQVIFGFSAPTITRSWTTDYLLVGTASGNILSYRLTNGQPQLRDDHAFSSLRDGHRSKIQLADINGDGYLEGFTGNSRGGVVLYRSSILVDEVLSTPQISPWQVRLSPNPTTEVLTISHQSLQPLQLIIFDSKGVSLVEETVRTSQADLSLQAFPSGVYFLQVGDRSDRRTFRFVKL